LHRGTLFFDLNDLYGSEAQQRSVVANIARNLGGGGQRWRKTDCCESLVGGAGYCVAGCIGIGRRTPITRHLQASQYKILLVVKQNHILAIKMREGEGDSAVMPYRLIVAFSQPLNFCRKSIGLHGQRAAVGETVVLSVLIIMRLHHRMTHAR